VTAFSPALPTSSFAHSMNDAEFEFTEIFANGWSALPNFGRRIRDRSREPAVRIRVRPVALWI
jgi:hypothetical protein